MTGSWPKREIDHANRVPSDDRWKNLREASRSQQNQNQVRPNKTGFKNVSPDKKKFVSYINLDGKRTYLGRFDTAAEAHAAYVRKARELFGEFHCPG